MTYPNHWSKTEEFDFYQLITCEACGQELSSAAEDQMTRRRDVSDTGRHRSLIEYEVSVSHYNIR